MCPNKIRMFLGESEREGILEEYLKIYPQCHDFFLFFFQLMAINTRKN